MPLIKWNDSFSVKIKEIDEQHQLLVEMIKDLYDAMGAGKEEDILGELIKRLSSYAVVHFAKEEHYFEIFGYPDADLHIREHTDFEVKVTKFESDFAKGLQSLSMDMLNFLSNWLVGHIKGSDKKYAPFLIDRGLK